MRVSEIRCRVRRSFPVLPSGARLALAFALVLSVAQDGAAGPLNAFERAGRLDQEVFDEEAPGGSVNLITGALVETHSLARMSPAASVSCAVAAQYNSKATWRLNNAGTPAIPQDDHFDLRPSGELGFGWSLTLGRVGKFTNLATAPDYFVDSAGTPHLLYSKTDASTSRTHYLTRDGSLIRGFKTAIGWKLYLPNGTILEFNHSVPWKDDEHNGYYLTSISDPFGNRIRVAYHPAPHETVFSEITDTTGLAARRITTELLPDAPPVPPSQRGLVSALTFPAAHSAIGRVEFDYGQPLVVQPPLTGWPQPPVSHTVAVLRAIRFPLTELATTFDYQSQGSPTGELTHEWLPTGALVWYVYQNDVIVPPGTVRGRGVGSRHVYLDANIGNPAPDNLRTWSYVRYQGYTSNPPGEYVVRVRYPTLNWRFVHFRTQDPRGSALNPPLRISETVWDRPFANLAADGAPPAGVQVLAENMWKWELDDATAEDKNARVTFVTTQSTEGGRTSSASTSLCNWNGLGRFATTVARASDPLNASGLVNPIITQILPAPITCQWMLHPTAQVRFGTAQSAVKTQRAFDLDGRSTEDVVYEDASSIDPIAQQCDRAALIDITFSSAGPQAEAAITAEPVWPSNVSAEQATEPEPSPGCSVPAAIQAPLAWAAGDRLVLAQYFGSASQGPLGVDEDGHEAWGSVKRVEVANDPSAPAAQRTAMEAMWAYGKLHGLRLAPLGLLAESTDIEPSTGLPLTVRETSGAGVSITYDILNRVKSVTPLPTIPAPPTGASAELGISIDRLDALTTKISRGGPATPSLYQERVTRLDAVGRVSRESVLGANGTFLTRLFNYGVNGSPSFASSLIDCGTDPMAAVPPPLSGVAFSYDGVNGADPFGRLFEVNRTDGVLTRYSYSADSVAVTYSDVGVAVGTGGAANQATYLRARDGFGRVRQVVPPPTELSAEHRYDALGRLGSILRGSQVRSWEYDPVGQLLEYSDPEEGSTVYADYTPLGKPRHITDATGYTTSVTYDSLERPTRIEVPNGFYPWIIRDIEWDNPTHGVYSLGRVTSTSTPDFTHEFYYDGLSGRLSREVFSGWCGPTDRYDRDFAHNALGRPLGLSFFRNESDPPAPALASAYQHGQLASLVDQGTSILEQSTVWTPAGITASRVLGNGVTEEWQANIFGEVTRMFASQGASSLYDSGSITRDGLRAPLSANGSDGQRAWQYDLSGRLSSWQVGTDQVEYAWDQQGNLITRLLNGGTQSCVPPYYSGAWQFSDREYRGGDLGAVAADVTNRVSVLDSLCPEQHGPTYDAAGRMMADSQFSIGRDDAGRMMVKTDLAAGLQEWFFHGPEGGTTVWRNVSLGPPPELLGERLILRDSQGYPVTEYERIDVPLGNCGWAWKRDFVRVGGEVIATREAPAGGAAEWTWLTSDETGSIRRATDQAGGTVGSWTYEPFGAILTSMVVGYERLHGAGGFLEIGGSDYLSASVRSYSPANGAFREPDPLLSSSAMGLSGANRYQMAFGNPAVFSDPLGLEARPTHEEDGVFRYMATPISDEETVTISVGGGALGGNAAEFGMSSAPLSYNPNSRLNGGRPPLVGYTEPGVFQRATDAIGDSRYLDCVGNCVKEGDVLHLTKAPQSLLTAAPFARVLPKSALLRWGWIPNNARLGASVSTMTSPYSVGVSQLFQRKLITLGESHMLRTAGRGAGAAAIGVGVSYFLLDVGCAGACAHDEGYFSDYPSDQELYP